MLNTKFPNAEYINYVCQTVINEKIYKIIQGNYLSNIINIESNQILKETSTLPLNNYNILDKLTLTKTLIKNAQHRASQILDGRVPETLCCPKFKYEVFRMIFNESYYKTEKQILKIVNFIFLEELKKSDASSIEEYLAALQYFISAGVNLAIDTQQIKSSLNKSLAKHLKNLKIPFFKENATIVGQAGKETIKALQRSNALSYEKIVKYTTTNKIF